MPDRETIIKRLRETRKYLEDKEWSDRMASPHIDNINDAIELLKEQSEQKFFVDYDGKITPLPIRQHGDWIPIKTPTGVKYGGFEEYAVQEVMCSECGFTDDVSASIYTYCPECGAKMDEGVKQDG